VNPGDELPLTMIASDVAHEIKVCQAAFAALPSLISVYQGALWNGASRKAYWDSDEIDVALYADALISVFRFLPEEDSIPLFVSSLEPERSDAVKTCVVRAMLTLEVEASRIPAQRSLDNLMIALARRFRDVWKVSKRPCC